MIDAVFLVVDGVLSLALLVLLLVAVALLTLAALGAVLSFLSGRRG